MRLRLIRPSEEKKRNLSMMRFRRTLTVTTAVAATTLGTAALVGFPATSALAATTSVQLPISQYSHMLVDPAHKHLHHQRHGLQHHPGHELLRADGRHDHRRAGRDRTRALRQRQNRLCRACGRRRRLRHQHQHAHPDRSLQHRRRHRPDLRRLHQRQDLVRLRRRRSGRNRLDQSEHQPGHRHVECDQRSR
jgi:hypothetical protein